MEITRTVEGRGRGFHTRKFMGFEHTPDNEALKVIEARKQELAEAS